MIPRTSRGLRALARRTRFTPPVPPSGGTDTVLALTTTWLDANPGSGSVAISNGVPLHKASTFTLTAAELAALGVFVNGVEVPRYAEDHVRARTDGTLPAFLVQFDMPVGASVEVRKGARTLTPLTKRAIGWTRDVTAPTTVGYPPCMVLPPLSELRKHELLRPSARVVADGAVGTAAGGMWALNEDRQQRWLGAYWDNNPSTPFIDTTIRIMDARVGGPLTGVPQSGYTSRAAFYDDPTNNYGNLASFFNSQNVPSTANYDPASLYIVQFLRGYGGESLRRGLTLAWNFANWAVKPLGTNERYAASDGVFAHFLLTGNVGNYAGGDGNLFWLEQMVGPMAPGLGFHPSFGATEQWGTWVVNKNGSGFNATLTSADARIVARSLRALRYAYYAKSAQTYWYGGHKATYTRLFDNSWITGATGAWQLMPSGGRAWPAQTTTKTVDGFAINTFMDAQLLLEFFAASDTEFLTPTQKATLVTNAQLSALHFITPESSGGRWAVNDVFPSGFGLTNYVIANDFNMNASDPAAGDVITNTSRNGASLNGFAAGFLERLYQETGNAAYRTAADEMFRSFAYANERNPDRTLNDDWHYGSNGLFKRIPEWSAYANGYVDSRLSP